MADNSSSRQIAIRVPLPIAEWLEKTAQERPENRYNQVGTEINRILKDAYDGRDGR